MWTRKKQDISEKNRCSDHPAPKPEKNRKKQTVFFSCLDQRSKGPIIYSVGERSRLVPEARDSENGAVSDVSRFHGSPARRPSSRINGQGVEGGKMKQTDGGREIPYGFALISFVFPLYLLHGRSGPIF